MRIADGRPQLTYSELISTGQEVDPKILDDCLIDEALGLTAQLLIRRDSREAAAMLGRVARIEKGWYQGWSDKEPGLYLEHEPEDAEGFATHDELLSETFREVTQRKSLPLSWIQFREVMPQVTYGWRQNLTEALDGQRPSNHARKLPPAPQYAQDFLAFTNVGELTVYNALKKLQESAQPHETLGIFPLPAGRILGHTWEPDVLITYRGRVGALEIDGPHHNRRRALDTTRDSLFEDAGIAYVYRIPVEVLNDAKDLRDTLRRFLIRLRDK